MSWANRLSTAAVPKTSLSLLIFAILAILLVSHTATAMIIEYKDHKVRNWPTNISINLQALF